MAKKIALAIMAGLFFLVVPGEMGRAQSEKVESQAPFGTAPFPIFIDHKGGAATLERPPVAFNHDQHTKALKQGKIEDCGICHALKEMDKRLLNPEVNVFRFPKGTFDETDKTAIMYTYHNECVSCHRKMGAEHKKAGPDIGLCGKCHVKKPEAKAVAWAWSPLFNYLRHSKHTQAADKFDPADKLGVAKEVRVIGETTGKRCETCHHIYDEKQKTLLYKKDTENSCRACHKATDEKNARAMKRVAHAACIGCHMKLAEKVKREADQQGRTQLTEQDKKRFGPFECKGCHGEHKSLKPEEIEKIPRLVRGQKDMIDVSLFKDPTKDSKLIRMKLVPFNHKAHEARGQFCSTCHHNSLERCENCHTPLGDPKKGGGISFERAFHETPANSSCLGCHKVAKETSKCAGCHRRLVSETPQCSCTVCHRGPSEGKPLEVPPLPVEFDKEKVPEKALIKVLEKEFKPAEMPHQKIIKKLTLISNESPLARLFHAAKDQPLCYGCHHSSQVAAANKFPECGTCHTRPFDPKDPGKPGAMAAFHQQCTGCHGVMEQKPRALDCDKCHPEKGAGKTVQVNEAGESGVIPRN